MKGRQSASVQSEGSAETMADALALLKSGCVLSAEALCRRLLAAHPAEPALHQLAATLALQKGEAAVASQWAASALALRPDHAPTLLIAGRAARSAQDPAKALEFFRRAAGLAPERPEPAFMTCVVLLELGRPDATDMLAHCLKAFPEDAPGWRIIGIALQEARQPDAALIAFTRALRAASSAELHLRRGAVLSELGRVEEAVAAFEAARAIEPRNFDAALQLGLCLRLMGDRAGARAALEEAVTLDASAEKGWFALGLAAQDCRDWPAAIQAYRNALKVQPDLAEAAVNLGIVLQESGDLISARRAYCEALRLRGDTFGRIAQALVTAPTGELWLDLEALRQSLAA